MKQKRKGKDIKDVSDQYESGYERTALSFDHASFEMLAGKEWLLTNGLGGFASGTLSGANTRRYHGLLVAALHPPTHRHVIVSKIEETIQFEGHEQISLSSNAYPGTIHPQGYRFLKKFNRDPVPTFTYADGQYKLRKRICMIQGKQATVIEYTNASAFTVHLELRPFLVFRDYHSLIKAGDVAFGMDECTERQVSFSANGLPPLFITGKHLHFIASGEWYYNTLYQEETARGLDDSEDLFSPGHFQVSLAPGEQALISLSLGEAIDSDSLVVLFQQELHRIANAKHAFFQSPLVQWAKTQSDLFNRYNAEGVIVDLLMAGDQFIVKRESTNGYSLIAGYPWFTDWGRDTMIAMRGLVISRGEKAIAKSIIQTFLQALSEGMLPNRFPDNGEVPEYNTIDATLWLFVVIHDFVERFDDIAFVKVIFPTLEEILSHHVKGTRYQIHMTVEGLLSGGEGDTQLTWMDAKMGDHAFTPRHGCAVEINALWYNALRIMHSLQDRIFNQSSAYGAMAEKTKESFVRYFYNGVYLNDVVIPNVAIDDAIRPNQLYAISLPYPIVSGDIADQVLVTVTSRLVTPLGLRTLESADPSYIGFYGGNQWQRDSAYHQGTVWPFLMGEYWMAYLRQQQYAAEAKASVARMMIPFIDHFYNAQCIHGISEVFDGDTPDQGKGCIHQAWSVSMMLTVLDAMMKN